MNRPAHLLSVLVLILLLGVGLAICAEPRAGSVEERAGIEMRRIERLAADPKADADKLWQELVDFRRCYPAQPQAMRATELMSQVRSPLDALDRKQIPEEDRLPWLPAEVVAVLGEHRGRHWGTAWNVTSSADGKVIASRAGDGVRVWDGKTLNELAHFPKGRRMALAPDGKAVAVAEERGTVRLWDLRTTPPSERGLIREHKDSVVSLGFTADSKQLLSAGNEKRIYVWDVAGDAPRRQAAFDLTKEAISEFTLEIGADATTVIAVPEEGNSIRVWKVRGAELAFWGELTDCSSPRTLAPGGKQLAAFDTAKRDVIRLWDLSGEKPKETRTIAAQLVNTYGIQELTFSPDSQLLAGFHSRQRDCCVWPLTADGRKQLQLDGAKTHLTIALGFVPTALRFCEGAKSLVLSGEDGTVRVWDIAKRSERHDHKGHLGAVTAVAFAPDGRLLASGGEDGSVRIWDLAGSTAKERLQLGGHDGHVRTVAFSHDGRWLASCGGRGPSGTVRLWAVTDGKFTALKPFAPHYIDIMSIALIPNSSLLITSGNDKESKHPQVGQGTVRMYELAKDDVRQVGFLHLELIARQEEAYHLDPSNLVVDSEGKRLAFVSEKKTVWIADIKGSQLLHWASLTKDRRHIEDLAFLPDGQNLITAGDDGKGAPEDDAWGPAIRLWNLKGTSPAESIVHIPGQQHVGFTNVAVSSEGRSIAAVIHHENQIFLWKKRPGDDTRNWNFPGRVNQVTFSPDNRHLTVANGNGTVYVLRLTASERQGGASGNR